MRNLSKYEGHTPGPWDFIEANENHGWYIEDDATGRSIRKRILRDD